MSDREHPWMRHAGTGHRPAARRPVLAGQRLGARRRAAVPSRTGCHDPVLQPPNPAEPSSFRSRSPRPSPPRSGESKEEHPWLIVFADGNTRVAFVGSISNIALPTTTELNAGILLHDTITDDGLMGFEATSADGPDTPLSGEFDTKYPGRDVLGHDAAVQEADRPRTRSSTR
jgi:hypothetical protein